MSAMQFDKSDQILQYLVPGRADRFLPALPRPVWAAFLHTVPAFTVSLKVGCDRSLVFPMVAIPPLAFWPFPMSRPVYLRDGWASYGVTALSGNSTSSIFGCWMSFHNRHNDLEAFGSVRLSVTACLIYACWLLSTHSFASARHWAFYCLSYV